MFSVLRKITVAPLSTGVKKLSWMKIKDDVFKQFGNICNMRFLSTKQNEKERLDFIATFPDILEDVNAELKKYSTNDSINISEILHYNVLPGKKMRGLLTVSAYKGFAGNKHVNKENLKLAQYLGWYIEMYHGSGLMEDDIMDGSTKRRGKLSWHLHSENGLKTFRDPAFLRSLIYCLLKKHFKRLACYKSLVEIFNEVLLTALIAQTLDMQLPKESISNFSMQKYKHIIMAKSYTSFDLPVLWAMYLAGIRDTNTFYQVQSILREIGNNFQIQDDFLDCFGDLKVVGKSGTDIQENKCTWLAVTCLQKADSYQRAIMEECYGKKDEAKIAAVKCLYEDLGIPDAYAKYQQETFDKIRYLINKYSKNLPVDVFEDLLNFLYKRNS